MTEKGPARDAGVRTGWHVSLHETFSRRENKDLLHHLTPQKVLEDPELIRTIPNLTLMLEPANAEPQEFFCGKERSWTVGPGPGKGGENHWKGLMGVP
eukprot:g23841.t1